MMSEWWGRLPPATMYGTAFIALLAILAGIKLMQSKKSKGPGPAASVDPNAAAKDSAAVTERAVPPDEPVRPKIRRRAFVLPIGSTVLLLVAIGAAVLALTRWKLGDPAWDLAGLLVIVAMLFGIYVFVITVWLFTRVKGHGRSPPILTTSTLPPADDAAREASQQLESQVRQLETQVKQLVASLGEEQAAGNLSIAERLQLLETRDDSFTPALKAIEKLKTDIEQLDKRFAPAGLKPTLDHNVALVTQLSASVDLLREQMKESATFIDALKGRELVQNLILDRTAPPSELASKVRWRYQLLRKNEKYRHALTAWAESDALRQALKHIRDLRVLSANLLIAAPASLTPARLKHWRALNQMVQERFEAMTLFFDRLQRMKAARDDSEETMRAMLLGLRPLEEEYAWSMVPGSRREDAPVLLYDNTGVERALSDSARKIVELVLTPLILLFQELFEAREIEENVSAAERMEYEMGEFADDRSSRGSVAAAINSAAAQLGYKYHPIRLFSTTTSESGMLLKPSGQTHVTWKEWYGRDDDRRGVIVRVKRPAFTPLNDPGTLLQEGALVLIGGPGNAGRD
jgi:hypothetical protein